MDIDGLLGPDPVVIDLRSENPSDAIEELVAGLVGAQKVQAEHKVAIISAVRIRESAMGTGVGFGIALPHASTDLVADVVVAIGLSRKGIRFDAIDGKPVNLVVLFLVPAGQFQEHVNTLANIAKLLHSDGFRDDLWRRFM